MYTEIEEVFIEQAQFRKSRFRMLLFAVLVFIAYVWVASKINTDLLLMLWALGSLIFFFGSVYGWLLFSIRKVKEFNKKQFWDVYYVIELYHKRNHDADIAVLKRALEEHHIDTKAKMEEAIRHYQMLIPRNVKSGSSWLSVLSLAIAVIALLVSGDVLFKEPYMEIASMMFWIIISLYMMYLLINKGVLWLFGSIELYKRLEASISEIYMQMPEETSPSSVTAGKRKRKYGR